MSLWSNIKPCLSNLRQYSFLSFGMKIQQEDAKLKFGSFKLLKKNVRNL